MNRIDAAFEKARSENRSALIPFITCGDPDLEATLLVRQRLTHRS